MINENNNENQPKYYRVVTETVIQRVYEVEAATEEAARATVENDIDGVEEGTFYHRDENGERCPFHECNCEENVEDFGNLQISFMGSTAWMNVIECQPSGE